MNQKEKEPKEPKSHLSAILTTVVSIVVALIGIVPALLGNSPEKKSGTAPVSVSVIQNFSQDWHEGYKVLTGSKNDSSTVDSKPQANVATNSPRTCDASVPENLSLGRLGTNISLIDGSTWSTGSSCAERVLVFDLIGEAAPIDDQLGHANMTLRRDGKAICTFSINSLSSNKGQSGRYTIADCRDTLSKGIEPVYSIEAKSTNMTLTNITARSIDARKR